MNKIKEGKAFSMFLCANLAIIQIATLLPWLSYLFSYFDVVLFCTYIIWQIFSFLALVILFIGIATQKTSGNFTPSSLRRHYCWIYAVAIVLEIIFQVGFDIYLSISSILLEIVYILIVYIVAYELEKIDDNCEITDFNLDKKEIKFRARKIFAFICFLLSTVFIVQLSLISTDKIFTTVSSIILIFQGITLLPNDKNSFKLSKILCWVYFSCRLTFCCLLSYITIEGILQEIIFALSIYVAAYICEKEICSNNKQLVATRRDEKILRTRPEGKVGKEKYLATIRDWAFIVVKQKEAAALLDKISTYNATYRPMRYDSDIISGMATAIGGFGAGLEAGVSAEEHNQAQLELKKEKFNKAINQGVIAMNMGKFAAEQEKKVQSYLEKMKDVKIDTSEVLEKFKMIECGDYSFKMVEGVKLEVTMKMKLLVEPTIESRSAILDGTLKVSVLNENNKEIAVGYYMAPGYGAYNYKNAGFKQEEEVKIICDIRNISNFNPVKCNVVPISMWLIEKSETIFRIDNKKIEKNYKACKDEYEKQGSNVVLSL